ncbi:protein kinase domain-containing protein [Thermoflavimicrobium daqui]|jgi:serine/threonine protein kinase|uniref:Protein kinase domain-containing protein n=1 Tax=Thermoflavimicrobium daqui TaxID=2137476 RepID=A0A364K9N1_9BACL|nr:hypothetical protein [Thermoflavimicrobium daqui]RAL26910.1 hypothetical protein DL897_02355 [Thermoflavimicrobium daqui]
MNIQKIVAKYKIFIDTCTWMFPQAVHFLENELPRALYSQRETVKLPVRVIDEVNKHLKSEIKETRYKARKAAEMIKLYIRGKILEGFGSSADNFVDQTILTVFTNYRTKYHLAFITQDRKLAQDVDNLNRQKSVRSNKHILVLTINQFGQLSPWNFNLQESNIQELMKKSSHKSENKKIPFSPSREKMKKLPLGKKVKVGIDHPLPVLEIPQLNQLISTRRFGPLRLIEKVGSGGEGDIYLTSNGQICKIYKKTSITQAKLEKLCIMLKYPIDKSGICWPQDLVFNSRQQFVGYIMPKAVGKPLQRSIFVKPLLQKNFPYWKRSHLVQLALAILEKIQYLHERNIIIGDLNPLNILIKNEREVFLVDTDSFQIAEYPCPVGTVNYTAPEIQGKKFGGFLRSFQHEYFAVATLIFMILLPGKAPFAQQDGGSPQENIKNGNFPYPLGQNTTGKAPDGPWRFIWSHLPFKTKEAFYRSFKEQERLNTMEWIQVLKHYEYTISKGYLSDELFPQGHKIPAEKRTTAICQEPYCGKEFDIHIDRKKQMVENGNKLICYKCQEKIQEEKLMKNLYGTENEITSKDQMGSFRSNGIDPHQDPFLFDPSQMAGNTNQPSSFLQNFLNRFKS